MKAVIFGANGQDGHFLAAACRRRAIEVIGSSRSGGWELGDVGTFEFVNQLIRAHRPDFIFSLAANSTTSHDALFEHHRTIGGGTLNILESVRRYVPECKVFIAGSGLQFINNGLPISEKHPFAQNSTYAVARNYSVSLARYFRQLGVRSYIGYLFHHESPLRNSRHISQKIIHAVQRISQGSSELLELGDISVRKEWSYAGDVAEGIMVLALQDDVFEATIGSGKAYSIADWLDVCFTLINKDWRAHTKEIQDFISEYPVLVSDPSTINDLGWRTSMELQELATLMLLAK